METPVQLIRQAQGGDTRALNRLFSGWYRPVYNIAYRYFGDADRAAEATQQTFVAVQQKLGQLREPAAFRVWLYRAVINQCHAEARRGQARRRIHDRYAERQHGKTAPGPEELYQRTERKRLVLEALQRIPAEQRAVLIMKEYEGLTFREIAEVLELSENTVKSRLYYGLKALRRLFTHSELEKSMNHDR